MQLIIGMLIGAVAGAVPIWFLMAFKSSAELTANTLRAEGDAKALQSTITELRENLSAIKTVVFEKDKEVSCLRTQLKDESELKAGFQSQLQEARSQLEELPFLRETLSKEKQLRTAAETRLEHSVANLEEQKKILAEAREQLTNAFAALSAEALNQNNDVFLKLANSRFETLQANAKNELDVRQNAVDSLIAPLKESLERYEKQIRDMENTRQSAYGSLDEQLRTLMSVNQQLQKETGSLVTALRTPQVRGRWGEMTLRRAAELAGMTEHCDFNLQETLQSEGNRQRPDMIVNLPNGRRIIVDAKAPLQAFLDAVSSTTEAERTVQFAKHGQLVRTHMNQLAARSYWEQFSQAPEIVILFLPGESFFAAAAEQDPTLVEDGMLRKVILATPTTLIALLRAIAYGWQQEDIAKNAQEISELGKALHDRIRTFVSHFEGVGSAMRRSVDSFNKARASLESRVLPAARKFKDLKATSGDEIIEINPIDEVPTMIETFAAPDSLAETGTQEG